MHSCRQRRTLDYRMRQCSSGFVRHRPQPGAWIRKSRAVRVPLGKSQTLPLTAYEGPPVSPKREPQWCPKDCGVGDCGPKSPPPLCPVQPHHLSTPQSPHLQMGMVTEATSLGGCEYPVKSFTGVAFWINIQ